LPATTEALERAFAECDAVVTSGGVSVGEMDFVKAAFEKLGGKQDFWKVNIKPGKPFVFGELTGKLLFGLPGNPVSALVTFFLLVRPALLRWQGAATTSAPVIPGILAEPLNNPADRRHFMRVTIDGKGNVQASGVQASHILGGLAKANGLADVPARTEIPAGSRIPVMIWD
jgi:molybdopterin molybdotransferase